MKKNTKKKIGIGCGVIFLLFVVFIIWFILGFLEDKTETRKEMKKIQKEYVTFKSSIESYNTIRDQLYASVFKDTYYNTFKEKDPGNKEMLKEAEKIVKQVATASKSLKKACDGVIYPDVSINTKCSSFSLAYEQVINSFVSDVDAYNKQIDAYNTWIGKKEEQVESYKTKRTYIDYNQDKKYSGKEEVEDGK